MWSEQFYEVDTDALRDSVIPKDEEFVRGWCVVFINEYNQEQDRVFLLSNKAYYRVKYIFNIQKVLRFQRIDLRDITLIQKGYLGTDVHKGSYALRIYSRDTHDDQTYGSYRTYKPLNAVNTKEIVEQIINGIARARKNLLGEPIIESETHSTIQDDLVEELEHLPSTSSRSVLSKAHNALGLGRQRRIKSATFRKLEEEQLQQESLLDAQHSAATHPIENSHDELRRNIDSVPKIRTHRRVQSMVHDVSKINDFSNSLSSSVDDLTRKTKDDISVILNKQSSRTIHLDVPTLKVTSAKKSTLDTLVSENVNGVAPPSPSILSPLIPTSTSLALKPFDISQLVEKFDTVNHFTLVVILAFLAGYFNWSYFWIPIFMLFLYKLDLAHQLSEKRKMTREIKQNCHLRDLEKTQNNVTTASTPSAIIPSHSHVESCHWFNILFKELWRHISKDTAEATVETVTELLEEFLELEKPPFVKSITIVEMNLGNLSPTLRDVMAVKPKFPDYRFDFDVTYFGQAFVIADVEVGFDGLSLKVPISIENIDISGRMRIDLTFFPKLPYLHTISYAFLEMPHVDASIKLLKAFDAMSIPYLKEWIVELIREVITKAMVLPEHVTFPYHRLFPDALSSIPPMKIAEIIEHSHKASVELERHHKVVDRSLKEGVFDGLLHVRIIEARKLILDLIGANSSPYCLISTCPEEVYTTTSAKRSRTPSWNEFFELLVTKNSEKKLEVTMLARDSVNGDDLIGQTKVDWSAFGSEARDMWVTLHHLNKKRERIVTGEIHLQIRYVPPSDLTNADVEKILE